jgi:hypothetical protein
MRICPNCGNPLGGSPRYCAGCATQVGPEDETASGLPTPASPAAPLPVRSPAPAWSFRDPPGPWLPGAAAPPLNAAGPADPPPGEPLPGDPLPGDPPPGEPAWSAGHPAWIPGEPARPAYDPAWTPGDPGWAARHPSREPDEPPWPASEPPWVASPPPWPASDPPWAVVTGPAAEDQSAAVITQSPGTSPPGAPRGARPGHRPWLTPGHGMTITAMVTTLALLGTLAAAAWQVGHIRSQAPAAGTSLAARASGTGRRAGAPDPGPSPARAAPSGSPGAPAASAVTVAPAAAGQPHVDRVVTLLDSYFSAINQHDFPAYRSLFIPAIRAGMHNFGASYQSTRDSRARLAGLAATGPQGLAAMVTFVSHQDPAASPDHAACDRWHITLFIKRDGRGYHIRRHRPGFPADTVRACR